MEITSFARVENHALCFRSYGKLQSELQLFEGKEVEVTIRKKRMYRGNPVNRYYWSGVLGTIQSELQRRGFSITKEKVHELMKFKFLKAEIISTQTGEVIETLGSTTKLTNSEFSDYISQIKEYCARVYQFEIPEANSQLNINDAA